MLQLGSAVQSRRYACLRNFRKPFCGDSGLDAHVDKRLGLGRRNIAARINQSKSSSPQINAQRLAVFLARLMLTCIMRHRDRHRFVEGMIWSTAIEIAIPQEERL